MLHITTKEELKKIVNEHEKVVVDFYATWCGPCSMLAPIIEEVAKENEDITVVKVDTDEAQELAELFNIMSIPTVAYIKNKEVKFVELGFRPKAKVVENINKYLN